MSTLRGAVNKLLKGIQSGNEADKERLFELTYNHLRIIARGYIKNENDIEDIMQTVYLRAFRYVDSVDLSKDGYNWLCRIVEREVYRFLEKNTVHVSIDDCVLKADERDITDLISDRDEIRRYLQGCSELDLKLIYLKFYKDYSYAEIAKIMNMKRSNAHRRVSKVLKEIFKKQKEMDKAEKWR